MNLDDSFAFDAPTSEQNGMGGTISGWAERWRCPAHVRYLRGGERVMQGRLSGVQPVVLTIRACRAAEAIGRDWRARDVRRGTIYNIRSIVPSDDRAMLELTCEEGAS